jgi:hypothetical protein
LHPDRLFPLPFSLSLLSLSFSGFLRKNQPEKKTKNNFLTQWTNFLTTFLEHKTKEREKIRKREKTRQVWPGPTFFI